MKLYTISEISEKLNINQRTVSYRFERLGIVGKWKINKYYFTYEQLELISVEKNKIQSFPLLSDPKYYHRQILILEEWMHQEKKSARKIANEFQVPTGFTEKTIKLFIKRECIIVQSKINKL